jgi:hypothetical protein
MTTAFKIISGHYHNLTYTDNQEVVLSFNMLRESDIQFVVSMGGVSDKELKFREYLLESKKGFSAKYTGKSRIDGSPMFISDISQVRGIIIDDLLKT